MDANLYDEVLDAVRTFKSLTNELRQLVDDTPGSDEEPPDLGPVAQR